MASQSPYLMNYMKEAINIAFITSGRVHRKQSLPRVRRRILNNDDSHADRSPLVNDSNLSIEISKNQKMSVISMQYKNSHWKKTRWDESQSSAVPSFSIYNMRVAKRGGYRAVCHSIHQASIILNLSYIRSPLSALSTKLPLLSLAECQRAISDHEKAAEHKL